MCVTKLVFNEDSVDAIVARQLEPRQRKTEALIGCLEICCVFLRRRRSHNPPRHGSKHQPVLYYLVPWKAMTLFKCRIYIKKQNEECYTAADGAHLFAGARLLQFYGRFYDYNTLAFDPEMGKQNHINGHECSALPGKKKSSAVSYCDFTVICNRQFSKRLGYSFTYHCH